MTEVTFHFNMPDKFGYVLRLLRKAYAKGARVVVTGEPEQLRKVDRELWNMATHEFVAHCTWDAPQSVLRHSPVVLHPTPPQAPHHDVLVNLGAELPQGFERFARVIDMVSMDPADRAQGRARWRQFTELGYAIQKHDLAAAGDRA